MGVMLSQLFYELQLMSLLSGELTTRRRGRSRDLGLAKTRLQHPLTKTAMNIVSMMAQLKGVPPAHTRTSRLAALAPEPDYV